MNETEQKVEQSNTEHSPKQRTSVADIPAFKDYVEQFYPRHLLNAIDEMFAVQVGRTVWRPNLGAFVCQQKIDHVADNQESYTFTRLCVLGSIPILCGWENEVTFPPEIDREFVLTYNGTIGFEFTVNEHELIIPDDEHAQLAIDDLATVMAQHLSDVIVEFFRTASGSEFTPGIYMKPNPKLNQYRDLESEGKTKTTVVFSWDFQCFVPSMPEALDTFVRMSMDSLLRTLTHFDNLQLPEVSSDDSQEHIIRTDKLRMCKDRYDATGRQMVAGIAQIYNSVAHAFAQPEGQLGEFDGPKPTTH